MGMVISEWEVSCGGDAGSSASADDAAGWFCCAEAGAGENADQNTNKTANVVHLTNMGFSEIFETRDLPEDENTQLGRGRQRN
jgi:hypothetical protein